MNTKIDYIKDNPYGKYNGNELDYVLDVLDSEDMDRKSNPYVNRFEKKFGKVFKSKYSIAHNSGTSTLHSCLVAAGVECGDEVISPAHTVIMNSFVTLHMGAIPVYVDIDPDTFNMCPKDLEKKITSKTKAIQVVHMHGNPSDMVEIMKIAKKYNIPVIEDSAQCVLGYIDGQLVGTFGDMASWSFENKKHISTGEGGMVTTDNKEYGTIIRKHGGLGYKTLQAGQSLRQLLPKDFQNPYYKRHDTLGYNYRMTNMQAAIGLSQIEIFNKILEKRNFQILKYSEYLSEIEQIKLRSFKKWCSPVHWLTTITLLKKNLRNKLIKFLIKNGVDARPMINPVHKAHHFKKYFNSKEFKNSIEISKNSIHLPSSTLLKEKEIKFICKKIKLFFNKKNK